MSARTRRILILTGAAIVVVAVILQVAVPAHHGHGWKAYWYNSLPGFYGLLGFGGCWLIVKASKLLGKVWLQRPEDYYGEADPDAE